ncbi:MAG: YhfT family protein [bacterium]|jgi:hypothetical protein
MHELLSLRTGLITLATALVAFLANRSMGIYFNALRPFFPDYLEGKMTRKDLSTIVFGLSVGSVLGSGIPLAMATGVMNGPLLFIAAGAIGCLFEPAWAAILAGAAWEVGVNLGLKAVLTAADALPFNFLPSLTQLGSPLLTVFSLFPAVAVTRQYGRRPGLTAFGLSFLARQTVVVYLPRFSPEAAVLLTSIVCLAFFAGKDKTASPDAAAGDMAVPDSSLLLRRGQRLRQNLPYLVLTGAVIATLSYLRIFGKSAVAVFALREGRITDAALADLVDDIGFFPIRLTTIMVTGVYSVVGLFGPSLAYFAPNIFVAALIGGAAVVVEAMGAFQLSKLISRFPAIGRVSKTMTVAMTDTLTLGLLFGSILTGDKMAGSAGLFSVLSLYLYNEAAGRPVNPMAAGPLAALLTGLLLNILVVLGLFTIPA